MCRPGQKLGSCKSSPACTPNYPLDPPPLSSPVACFALLPLSPLVFCEQPSTLVPVDGTPPPLLTDRSPPCYLLPRPSPSSVPYQTLLTENSLLMMMEVN